MSRAVVRRVLVLPGLWAPFHHGPAVSALTAYVRETRPDRVVFLDAPEDRSGEAWSAFAAVVADFRAACTVPIGVHGGRETEAAVAALAGLDVAVLPTLAEIAPGLARGIHRPHRSSAWSAGMRADRQRQHHQRRDGPTPADRTRDTQRARRNCASMARVRVRHPRRRPGRRHARLRRPGRRRHHRHRLPSTGRHRRLVHLPRHALHR
jgi:hypothetical protein